MYSKTMILFFSLALYLLECQGRPPTSKQREIIRNMVRENVGQDGTGYEGLKDVLIKVVAKLKLSIEFPGKDELLVESKEYVDSLLHDYTLEEVISVVKDFVDSESLAYNGTVQDCVRRATNIFGSLDSFKRYEELEDIIKVIKHKFKVTKHFPTYQEHKSALSNRAHYTVDQVENIVIEKLFSI
ncbi:uncharacterized protein LOC126842169 [Adelges cooleyi]|uniref:uncharacterized protein LOC126842169 n=2 Tax=Adelges cooleyi TaxID=133065 RepID=UPI002180464F|nr:uncharacterized protein LOC126842169 [Adelges cooleyi]